MENSSKSKLKNSGLLALLWVMLSLVLLGGVTFAWFTFTSYTNVTPMTGSIGNGGADLTISNTAEGPFGNETELIVNGSTENLQPVSTSDGKQWFTAVSHNTQGISNRFRDVTEQIDNLSMFGSVYLKSSGGNCNVYFDPESLEIGGEPQLLACCRLSLVIDTLGGSKEYVFNFDSKTNTGAVDSRQTVDTANGVVSAVDGDGVPSFSNDPSADTSMYSKRVDEEMTVTEAADAEGALCHIQEDEIVEVRWRLYIEGCDENCINEVQDKEVTMNLAFTGFGTN